MPYLRMEPDNTLASTLGNLGSSLQQAFDPMRQIQGQNLLSEMQQRQWELQQKQRFDAANRNAADVFTRTFTGILPPGVVEAGSAKILAGNGDIEGAVNAAKALKTYQGNQAAVAMIDADPEMQSWDAADRENVKAHMLNDPSMSLSDAKKAHATQKQEEIKLSTTQGGVASAQTPGAKLAMAIGQPETGVKLDAGAQVAGTQIDPSKPLAPQLDTLNAANLAAGYGRPPVGQALAPSLQPTADAATAAREAETQRQKDIADAITKGIPRTGNIIPGPLPGQPGNTIGAPYNPSPTPALAPDGTAAPPPKDVFLPNVDSPASLPVPVERTLPEGQGTIVGESEAEAATRQKTDTDTTTGIKEDIASGEAGEKMMALLNRLNTLADLSNTATSGGQLSAAVINRLREYHIVATDRAGLLAEMASLFQAQIPELRKDMGVKFEAGPELSAQGKMIGDPSLPVSVLKGIFARQATVAQLGINLRGLAMRAGQPGQAQPLTRADYLNQRAKLYDNLTAEMQQQMKDYGANTRESLAPPTPPPAMGGNSAMSAVHGLLQWLYGASGPPQQPQPPPPAGGEVWDVDANGKPFRR